MRFVDTKGFSHIDTTEYILSYDIEITTKNMKLPVYGPKNRKVKYRDLLLFNHYRSDDKVCIYRIIDKETDIKYIGQTFDTHNRLLNHKGSGPFSTLLRERGFTSIEFDILERDVDVENADDRERHYVSKFNTLEPNGYNRVTGGKKGGHTSDLLKEEVSVRSKWFEQEEHKDKHRSSLNVTDVQKKRTTSRKLHYDEKLKQMLPQFKMYTNEYTGYGSMKTIVNLMNISNTVYYKLLKMSDDIIS